MGCNSLYLTFISAKTALSTLIELLAEVDKQTLQAIIIDKVSVETTIYSDTWKSYQGLDQTLDGHQTVKGEYVNRSAGINGIEGFWGYAKERLLRYHGVSPQNFLNYLKEIEFRFNHRKLNQQEFVRHLLFVLIEITPANSKCPKVGGIDFMFIRISIIPLYKFKDESMIECNQSNVAKLSTEDGFLRGNISFSKPKNNLSTQFFW